VFLFGYKCTLWDHVRIQNRQIAAPNVHTVGRLLILCAKVVGATSSNGFLAPCKYFSAELAAVISQLTATGCNDSLKDFIYTVSQKCTLSIFD